MRFQGGRGSFAARDDKDVRCASTTLDAPPTPRTLYGIKNKVNGMSAEYAKALRKRYLKEAAFKRGC